VPRRFTLTFDYLCPFARNAAEHVIVGLRSGADWDVTFVPYSLSQCHVPEGEPAIWDRPDPDAASGVLALQVGLAVRDHLPERFLDVHERLFATRHDEGEDIKDREVLRGALDKAGVDPDEVFAIVDGGGPLATLRDDHERAVRDHGVWGVPTFITDERAVFVRLMDRPEQDATLARKRIEQVVDLVQGPIELHEFKQTVLPR
jgi:hypothetical protein